MDALATKKPGFLLNLWSTARDIAKNPVSGHLCVSFVWENSCHCVNALDALPTKKPGFLLNLWSTAKDIAKNPVSGHLCVSSVWENRCHCVNALDALRQRNRVFYLICGVQRGISQKTRFLATCA